MSMHQRGFLDFSAPRPDLRPFVEDDSAISWQGSGDCGCAQAGPPPQFDGLLDTAVRTGPPVRADWSLLRKFADFWPSELSAPPEFPWLATLVDRKKAWRWVSQFPQFFENVEYWHTETIQQFIAQTLTEVEPTASSGEKGDKECCKPKPEPRPEYDVSACFDRLHRCEDSETGEVYYVDQFCCLNDRSGYDCVPSCESAPERPGGRDNPGQTEGPE